MLFENHNNKLRCLLCPHACVLAVGEVGVCGVRKNNGEAIVSLTYGLVSSLALDPIEKKPLFHYYPGKNILSVGSFGCNLKCNFCQNWNISQIQDIEQVHGQMYSPQEIIGQAKQAQNNIGIAFTYNEPGVGFEFMYDTACLSKENELKNVMVSNGYLKPALLLQLAEVVDAFNIDLKAFDNGFYKTMTGGMLKPVLENLVHLRESGRHLEVTFLVITGKNDSVQQFKEMLKWIENELGSHTVLHINKYYPKFKQSAPATSDEVLLGFWEKAKEKLKYVYLGNTGLGNVQNTVCPNCGELIIERHRYATVLHQQIPIVKCMKCNEELSVVT
jgi:pyruvate formate lyase activating enzyme